MIKDKILEYLNGDHGTLDEAMADEVAKMSATGFRRQFMQPRQNVPRGALRLSAAGTCKARLAFQLNGFPEAGKQDDAATLLRFYMGDLVEVALIGIARLAGVSILHWGSDQQRVLFDAGGIAVPGHPDGVVEGPDGLWLLDVKSMAHFSFTKFEKVPVQHDPWLRSYYLQVQSYMSAFPRQIVGGIILAYDKDKSNISEQTFRPDAEALAEVRARFGAVSQSKGDEATIRKMREVEPDEKGRITKCEWCPYWKTCWGDTVLQREENFMGTMVKRLYVKAAIPPPKPKKGKGKPAKARKVTDISALMPKK